MNKPANPIPLKDDDSMADAAVAPSPCNSVCEMNPETGLCKGCFRTIDEIIQWSIATESEKRAIWREINRRKIPKVKAALLNKMHPQPDAQWPTMQGRA